jgi:predicted nucleic acid-binding protein
MGVPPAGTSCMTARVFVDTNIFVYSRQANEPVKQAIAAEWIERLWKEQSGRTSVQVVSEAYVIMTRKIRPALSHEAAWAYVQALFAWDPQALDVGVVLRAREIQQRYPLSWWDSLIVSAAQVQSCTLLLTEDLQDRAMYESLTVCNPFRPGVSEPSAAYLVAAPASSHPHRARGRPRRQRIS